MTRALWSPRGWARPAPWLVMAAAMTLLGVACDALVGGECQEGFVPDGTHCVPAGAVGGGSAAGGALPGGGGHGAGGHGGIGGGPGGTGAGGGPGGTGGGPGGTGGDGGHGGGCTSPLVNCGGDCVDLQTDFHHCGSCFHYCPTEICANGDCVGGTVGHLVVVGMNFQVNTQPMRTLLGNAVFLPPEAQDPVQIIDYREHVNNAWAGKVDDVVSDEATARGRSYDTEPVEDEQALPGLLASGLYDLLFIHHQFQAPPGELGATGTLLQIPVSTFLEDGGIVVVLAVDAGTDEMAALLSNAGLLQTTGFTTVTGEPVDNQAPGNVIGANVLTPFLAQQRTTSLATTELPSPSLVHVVTSAAGDPVVVYRWF